MPNKGVKRKIAEAAPLNTPPTTSVGIAESLVHQSGKEDNHDHDHDQQEQLHDEKQQDSSGMRRVGEGQQQHHDEKQQDHPGLQQIGEGQKQCDAETQQKSSGLRVAEGAITTTLQVLPNPSPRRPPAAKIHTPYRRVRCEVHKHHDEIDTVEKKRGVIAEASREGGGKHRNESGDKCEENIHVHGSDCGHAPVLHEGHVDFLLGRGKLDCHEHREVKRSCVLFVCHPPPSLALLQFSSDML